MRRVLSISVMMLLLLESVVAQNKPMAGDWVRGVVTDSLGNIIDRVSVMELNVAGDTVKEVPTDSLGAFNFILINPKDSIRFSKRGYWDTVVSINRLYYQISLKDKPEPEPEPESEPEPDLTGMVPAFDASENQERFIVCDYEESLIEVVPDSFICGYTFSPYGYKPYGIFLQKDSAGYRVILNYYKYDRDRIDDVMSTAVMEKSEWEAGNLIEAAKRDIDRAVEYQKGPKVDIARDFNVVKVLMDGKAAEHWNLIFLNDPWYDVFYDFKYYELGPEPMPNANRWEVTPYFNPSEKSDESYHWIGSGRFIDMSMILRYDNNICGNVFADYWGSGGCIVTETDSKGRLVNATCTDERGFFYLQVMDPDVLMLKASLTRYDEERGKFMKYKPVVKKIAKKEIDEENSSFWYTVSETRYLFNLNDAKVTRRPRQSRQKVVVVGKKPTTDSAFSGVVMDAIGPLKGAVITECDSNGDIVAQTRTGANGEFRFESVNPQNFLHISCEGYADVSHKIEGERFIITMKKNR